jgi:hypothetical protein
VFGDSLRFFGSSNIGAHRVSTEKQLTVPPLKRSKKNASTEIDQEEHHHDKDIGISHSLEPSHITDQERRVKLEALQKAMAEKTAHTLEQYTQQDAHENDDDAVDRGLEEVQQKIQQLQREKERFANQLQAKRKASEKLEKLNQAKEQIERIRREIDEMKE